MIGLGLFLKSIFVWIVIEDASPHIGCYGETTGHQNSEY